MSGNMTNANVTVYIVNIPIFFLLWLRNIPILCCVVNGGTCLTN